MFLLLMISMSDPAGARTLDPLIKSQLLYQLSYGVKIFEFHRGTLASQMRCKFTTFF